MNRLAIIGGGAFAFALAALIGAIWLDGSIVASAIYGGLGVALVLGIAEALSRPERRRQLAALEQLADQGRALPDAADALAGAVDRLGSLEEAIREGHSATLNETQRAIAEGADRTRSAVEKAVGEAKRMLETATDAQRASGAEERDAQRSAQHEEREATARVLRETAMQIREDLTRGVADAAKASQEAVAPVAAEAMRAATTAATSHLAEIQHAVESDAAERRRVQAVAVETLDAHLRSVTERLDTQLSRRSDADARVLIALEAYATQIREAEDHRAAELGQRWEQLSQTMHDRLAEVAKQDVQRVEDLGEAVVKIQTHLGTTTNLVRERLEASTANEGTREERAERLLGEVAKASTAMADATAQQCGALDAFAKAADERVMAAEDRGAARLADLALRFEAAAEAQQKRLAVFESEIADRHRVGAEALSERLSEHAQGVDTTLRETAQLVREASNLIHAGGGEMTAVAEMFAGAVDKQRDAANTWIESLSKIDRAVVDAGENAAVDVLGDYLARTHELFDQQLGFQQELFEQLTVGAHGATTPAPV